MAWPTKKPASGIPAKGAGYGGPATGDTRPAFTAENQPSGEEKSAGWDAAREVRARIAAKRVELADRLLTLSESGETDAIKLAATNSALDRLMGKPAQAIGGSDELGPVKMVVAWEDEG